MKPVSCGSSASTEDGYVVLLVEGYGQTTWPNGLRETGRYKNNRLVASEQVRGHTTAAASEALAGGAVGSLAALQRLAHRARALVFFRNAKHRVLVAEAVRGARDAARAAIEQSEAARAKCATPRTRHARDLYAVPVYC